MPEQTIDDLQAESTAKVLELDTSGQNENATLDQQIASIEALLDHDPDAPLANQGIEADVDSGGLSQNAEAAAEPGAAEPGGAAAQDSEQDPDENQPEVELSTEPDSGVNYDQVVPMPDGREAMTIGQMKDTVTALERERAQIVERENRVTAERLELDQVIQATGEIPENLKQLASQKREAMMQREHASMVEKIPEMQTREGFERVSNIVRNELLSNGVSEQEIAGITSSVVVKMVYDLARLKEQGKAAQELGKKVRSAQVPGKAPGQKTRRTELDKAVDGAMKSRNRDTKISAVDQLING